MLEKPRHNRLVEEIHAVGARVALYPAGDVAGAIVAAFADGRIDALMGTGGTPEGIISACAIRALGGAFWGRLDPQLATEKMRVREAGLSTERWYQLEELVMSPEVLFCATGITTGLLFEGVEHGSHPLPHPDPDDLGRHRRASAPHELAPAGCRGRGGLSQCHTNGVVDHPIILGIVGDSAAGKTTLTAGIAAILGADRVAMHLHRRLSPLRPRRSGPRLGITAAPPRRATISTSWSSTWRCSARASRS